MAVGFAIAGNARQPGTGFVGLRTAAQKQGRVSARMSAKKASEFEAGISGRAENRGSKFCRHHILLKYARSIRFLIFFIAAYLSIIMHKYSYILNGLAELSSRKPD